MSAIRIVCFPAAWLLLALASALLLLPGRAAASVAERQKEFDAKKGALDAQRTAVRSLKDSSPEAYLKGAIDYLRAQERLVQEYPELPHAAVGLRGDIGNEYLNLGHFARFRMKRPNQAIELYEAGRKSGNGLAALALPDTYQFDLRNKAQALARYRGLLDEQRRAPQPSNETEAGLLQFAKAWLAHQVDYLAAGKTFSGRIRQEECGAVALVLYYGAGGGTQDDHFDVTSIYRLLPEIDRKAIGQKLETLPASAFTLLRTAALASAMPDADSILRYLKKHDPAGFASACFLGMVDLIDRRARVSGGQLAMLLPGLAATPAGKANPMRVAAARFNKEHGIVAEKPDPRMASPEQTWQLFIGSLRKGDAETALSCLTPALQNRFRPLLGSQPPEKLRAMAESFTRGHQAGMIHFADVGGAWKISKM